MTNFAHTLCPQATLIILMMMVLMMMMSTEIRGDRDFNFYERKTFHYFGAYVTLNVQFLSIGENTTILQYLCFIV